MSGSNRSGSIRIEQEHFQSTNIRGDQIKNQYSTFIEQLQETTQQLMNQVFNTQYEPQIQQVENKQKEKTIIKSREKKKTICQKKIIDPQGFKKFIQRSKKWQQNKKMNITRQKIKQQQYINRQLTQIPQILRGSRQKLDPIYERAIDIHNTKQQNKKFKQIDQKKKEQEQIKSMPFHPKINNKNKTRSLDQYLKDKQIWEKKKQEQIEYKKIHKQAQKYIQCTFKPTLISKQFPNNKIQNQKVQERLLKTLEKCFDQLVG